MTRKDYELLASTLHTSMYVANTYPTLEQAQAAHEQYRKTVNAIANTLHAQYSNFNKERFLNACLGEK